MALIASDIFLRWGGLCLPIRFMTFMALVLKHESSCCNSCTLLALSTSSWFFSLKGTPKCYTQKYPLIPTFMYYPRAKSNCFDSLLLQCASIALSGVYLGMRECNTVNSGFLGISPAIYLKASLLLPGFLCLLAFHANNIL